MPVRLDDALVGAFDQELRYNETRVLEYKYPQFKFAEGLIVPVEYPTGIEWAETTAYRMITGVGQFELARDYTTTVPMVDVLSERFVQQVYEYVGGYYFSKQEAMQVAHLNMPIEEQKIAMVRRIAMQTLNKLIAFGDRTTGQPGFVNHPAWLRSYAAFPLNSNSSPTECLATLNNAVSSVISLTKGVEEVNTLLLTYRAYEYLNTLQLNQGSDKTVLPTFKSTNGHIQDIQPLVELEGAGPNGEDVMMIYRRDPEAIKARVTQAFQFEDLLRVAFGFQRSASFRYGGIIPYYPYSVHTVIGV